MKSKLIAKTGLVKQPSPIDDVSWNQLTSIKEGVDVV
jgi:hypothetical protein